MSKLSKFFIIISLLFIAAAIDRFVEEERLSMNQETCVSAAYTFLKKKPVIQRDTLDITNLLWQSPVVSEKGENWTFDLFTAPTIIQEEGAGFEASLPWLVKSQSTIDFEIISIEKRIYPIQFAGFFERPVIDGVKQKESATFFILEDTRKHEIMRLKLGDIIPEYAIELVNFAERGQDGELNGYPRLTVMDRALQQEVTLTPEKKYYEQLFDVELRSKENDAIIELSHVNEEFSIGDSTYILKTIYFEKKKLEFQQKIGKDFCTFNMDITEGKQAESQSI